MKLRKSEIKVPKEFLRISVENEKFLPRNIPNSSVRARTIHPSHTPVVRSHSALPPNLPRISETSLFSLMCFYLCGGEMTIRSTAPEYVSGQ